MSQLFASYLAKKVLPTQVEGAYDPKQDLWVGHNRLLASTAGTTATTSYYTTYTDWILDTDVGTNLDTDYTGG